MNEERTGKNAPLNDESPIIDSVIKQKKRYERNGKLALVGLSVLILYALGLFIGSFPGARPNNNVFPGSAAPISEETISSLTIQYYSPDSLTAGTPATFSVSISNSELFPTATTTNEKPLLSTPIPNGTPNVPISKAFGAGYMVCAYAQLDVSPASKFDLPQLKQNSQSLEQQFLEFDWTITPKETTPVVITITIIGQWKPIRAGNEVDIPLWHYSQNYVVASAPVPPTTFVIHSFSSLGSALIAILPVFGGLGLTIPWILDQFSKKRNKSKHSKKKSLGKRKGD